MIKLPLSFILLLFAVSVPWAAEQAPAWLQQASTINLPSYEKNVNTVVLLTMPHPVGEDAGSPNL